MSKLGLVFAGGGGKGAYEIGVWKAFKEFGIDKNISAVSGTSVGGLNGALFAKGDFKQGLKVWQEMSPDKILQVNPDKIISMLSKFNLPANILTMMANKLGFLKSEGIFSQSGLESIIKDSLKDGELKDKIPFYICATNVSKSSLKPIYKKLNNLSYEDIVKYLLSTSAIPIAFPRTEIDGIELLDGYLTDNTPMKPLIEIEKCDKIIVVLLGRSENIVKVKQAYPNVSFWEIVPSGDTKEMMGSLDFKNETANNLIEMGYKDSIKILQNLYEFMLVEQDYIKASETIRIQANGFKKEILNNSLLRQEYKKLKNSYNDMNSLQYLLSNPQKYKASETKNEVQDLSLDIIAKELEDEIDKYDIQVIDSELDKILDDMGDNSKEISKFTFEAVTSLSANDGKINYQEEQGLFSRIMGGITGSKHKLEADINLNFSKSIYANTQIIKKLAQRNNLTLDMCISLGNKVNFLAQNQQNLQFQNNEQLKMIHSLRDGLFTLANITKIEIQNNTARIEKLEYKVELINWRLDIEYYIKDLNRYESILKIVSSFYAIVKNSNDEEYSKYLYLDLIKLGFNEVMINPSAFIEYVVDNKKSALTLFCSNQQPLGIPKNYEVITPIFSAISKIYDNETLGYDTIISEIEENHNINLDVDITAEHFAFELLNGFKIMKELKESSSNTTVKFPTHLEKKDLKNLLSSNDINSLEAKVYKINSIGVFLKILSIEVELMIFKSKILKINKVSNINEVFNLDDCLSIEITKDKKCIVIK